MLHKDTTNTDVFVVLTCLNLVFCFLGKAKRRHLNAEECDALGQSAAGTSALVQPHTINKGPGKRDPNRGLYPKTPTKRRKCGNVL